jgi:oxygen-independent coproporphyrinogen-3 oxidase
VSAAPPLSLYVHLPWCVSKCPYCDFNSHVAGARADRDRYLDALVADLAGEAERAAGRPVASVFLGGGTPSLFTAAQIGSLLEAVGARLAVTPDAEVTMEANPGTVERGRLADYRAAGVNRLSLGVQSFDDGALRRLGRIHGAADAVAACREAQAAGFAAVNLDLMYALPGQTVAAALADLRQAVALDPAHLSWYELTLEPNTRFSACPPPDLPGEDEALAIERAGLALLAEAGYQRYEISAFARPGLRCRHNLNYWRFGDYLGVGAGAHGKLTDPAGGIWRRVKPAHPRAYMERMEAGGAVPATRVADGEIAFEYMLNALRLLDGFSEAEFVARTGLCFATVAPIVAGLRRNGLMEPAGSGAWRPSPRGFALLNDLQAAFLARPGAAPAPPAPVQAQV